MKCNKCGAELLRSDFCPECHADVSFYKRAASASNSYYNKGLEQAGVRDLSGAIESLKMAVLLDKSNVQARNLLGLCYYEIGEVVEGLSQWIISTNFNSVGNPASEYIEEVQKKRTDYDDKAQAARKYNQVLENALNENYDIALIQLKKISSHTPGFLKAQLMLALFYIEKKAYSRAEKILRNVLKVDAGNAMAKRYLAEIKNVGRDVSASRSEELPGFLRNENPDSPDEDRKPLSGNDIIRPESGYKRGNSGISSFLHTLIGIGIGAALIFFLIVPARDRLTENRYENESKEISAQLSEANNKLAASQKQVEDLTKARDALQEQIDGGASGYNKTLITAANEYIAGDQDQAAVTLSSLKDAEGNLGDEAKKLYDSLKANVGEVSGDNLYAQAMEAFENSEVMRASTLFESAYAEDNTNVNAAYYAARCYQSMQNTEKAKEYYQIIIDKFPESEYAQTAQDYIDSV